MSTVTTAEQTFRAKVPGIAAKLRGDFSTLAHLDICAILGNLGHECNGFTTLQETAPTVRGSRGGYGWPQWTGARRRAYEAYCKRNGLDPASDKANYAWLFLELKGSEARALTLLREASTLDNKVVAFERGYLRAGIPHYDSRRHWARVADETLRSHSVPAAPLPTGERQVLLNDEIRATEARRDKALANFAGAGTVGGLGTMSGTIAAASPARPVHGGEWVLLGGGLLFVTLAAALVWVALRHGRAVARLRSARAGGI